MAGEPVSSKIITRSPLLCLGLVVPTESAALAKVDRTDFPSVADKGDEQPDEATR